MHTLPSFCAAYYFSVAININFSLFICCITKTPCCHWTPSYRKLTVMKVMISCQVLSNVCTLLMGTSEKSNDYTNKKRNVKAPEIKVGDPVYWMKHKRNDKFDIKEMGPSLQSPEPNRTCVVF